MAPKFSLTTAMRKDLAAQIPGLEADSSVAAFYRVLRDAGELESRCTDAQLKAICGIFGLHKNGSKRAKAERIAVHCGAVADADAADNNVDGNVAPENQPKRKFKVWPLVAAFGVLVLGMLCCVGIVLLANFSEALTANMPGALPTWTAVVSEDDKPMTPTPTDEASMSAAGVEIKTKEITVTVTAPQQMVREASGGIWAEDNAWKKPDVPITYNIGITSVVWFSSDPVTFTVYSDAGKMLYQRSTYALAEGGKGIFFVAPMKAGWKLVLTGVSWNSANEHRNVWFEAVTSGVYSDAELAWELFQRALEENKPVNMVNRDGAWEYYDVTDEARPEDRSLVKTSDPWK